MDGYFVHFVAPENLPPMPKHVIFVLDTSGRCDHDDDFYDHDGDYYDYDYNDDNDDDGYSWLVGSHPCQQDSWQPTSVNLSRPGKTKADDDHDDRGERYYRSYKHLR